MSWSCVALWTIVSIVAFEMRDGKLLKLFFLQKEMTRSDLRYNKVILAGIID